MPLLNLTAASRAAGVGRSTIRALKSGRLSATANEQGERVIDTSELARVFGPLKGNAYPNEQAVDNHDIGQRVARAAVFGTGAAGKIRHLRFNYVEIGHT